jgi:hypothetical protein
MTYTELISRVLAERAAALRGAGAIGLRLSPIDLVGDEAVELAQALRAKLSAADHVAVGAVGASTWESGRAFAGDGDEVAQRATAWRNSVTDGALVVYVSAELLGRAGGLQDTLRAVHLSDLNAGLQAWLEGADDLPTELQAALVGSELAQRAGLRKACHFASEARGKALSEVGRLLPHLDLALDSRLGEDVAGRLAQNERWVNLAIDGRRSHQLSGAPGRVRARLIEAVQRHGLAGLGRVDLGELSLDELCEDAPGARAPRTPRTTARSLSAAPARATPAPAAATARQRPGGAGQATATGVAATPPPAGGRPRVAQPRPTAAPVRPTPEVAAPTLAPAGSPADTARDRTNPEAPPSVAKRPAALSGEDPTPAEVTNTGQAGAIEGASTERLAAPESQPELSFDEETDEVEGAEAIERSEGLAAPAEPEGPAPTDAADGAAGPPLTASERSDGPSETEKRPPRSRALSGAPWTPELQQAERPPGIPLPDGVAALLQASLEGGGDCLIWECAGPPAAAAERLPKGLAPAEPLSPAPTAALVAWRQTRAALLQGARQFGELSVHALTEAPWSVFGAPTLAPLLDEHVKAGRALLAEAKAQGSAAWADALDLETVTLRSVTGGQLVVLSPLHPILLIQLAERLPVLARAAKAEGAARAAFAAAGDAPPLVPMAWMAEGITLPWAESARWAPCYGDAPQPAGDLRAVSQAVVSSLLRLHPHAALALRIAAEVGAADVASAVAELLTGNPDLDDAHAQIETSGEAAVELGDGAAGRVECTPVDPRSSPHVVIRRAPAAVPQAVPPTERLDGLAPGPWRAGEAELRALNAVGALPSCPTTWVVVAGRRLGGEPPRKWRVLMRGSSGPDELVVLTADLRAASLALEPAFKALGVSDLRPTALQKHADRLAQTNGGLLAMDSAATPSLATPMARQRALAELSGEACIGLLDVEARRVVFGAQPGAFAVAGEADKAEVRLIFIAGDLSLAAAKWAVKPLSRALELASLCEGRGTASEAARAALARLFHGQGDQAAFVERALRLGRPVVARALAFGPGAAGVLDLGQWGSVPVSPPSME